MQLITAPIRAITEDGLRTAEGHEKVDVLVYATGFDANQVLWPIQIQGRDGADVRERLNERPEAYRGTAIEHCPNLFVIPGPNGTPGHGGSGIFFAECQTGYIMECLRAMFERGWSRIEVRGKAVEAYTDEVAAELEHYVWSQSGFRNWYRGARGRVTAIIAKRLIDFWQECKAPDLDAYEGS